MIDLRKIAAILARGGVVLLPTDTIYGLHAAADDGRAIQRIVDVKGRGEDKPFVVIAASRVQLETIGAIFDQTTTRTVDELWPGPLTAVVPLRAPIAASRGTSKLAVRVPALDWLRSLLEKTGPLASTSANRSGEPPLNDPKTMPRALRDALDAVVDEGLREGEPSTIVDFTVAPPKVIRDGESFFTQKVWKTLRNSL